MDEKDIKKYAQLMRELDLTGLEVTENNRTVRLERNLTAPAAQVAAAPVKEEAAGASDYYSVKSPFVGVFYSAPAENAATYAAIGDYVKKGQTLCIIEAMKMMNEIASEVDGEILEICAANGQVVEYGTELFRIKR